METVPDLIGRIKLILLQARDAGFKQGYDTYVLVAFRAVEELEKSLGLVPREVRPLRDTRKPRGGFRGPGTVEVLPEGPLLPCGRRSNVCIHTRARKPHSCPRYKGEKCYADD